MVLTMRKIYLYINEHIMPNKLTKEDFIRRGNEIHDNKYDYSLVEYSGIYEPVKIICPIHGIFEQTPNNHLNNKRGCPECGKIASSLARLKKTEQFIQEAENIHGKLYDYSQVIYDKSKIPVIIICKKHGAFEQTPSKHLMGRGCPECGKEKRSEKRKLTKDGFIEKARKVHGEVYNYDNVEYKDSKTNVLITCKKHGDFLQKPNKHLIGQGCPKCMKEMNVYENKLYNELRAKYPKLEIIQQYKNKNILNRQSIDIYFPKYKIGIEYQGIQHFKPVDHFGGYSTFLRICKNDKIKYIMCQKHNVSLAYFTYHKADIPSNYIDTVYYDIEMLFKKIDNIIKSKQV